MHFVLGCSPGRAIVAGPDVDEPWCEGRALDFPPAAPLVFTLDPDQKVAPASMYDGLMPLFCDRLMQAMRDAGADNIQAHPAVLQDPRSGQVWSPYWAVNVLGVVTAVDLEASGLAGDPEERGALEPSQFVLDPRKADPFRIFRLAESPDLILVDDRVRQAIARGDLSDLQLTPPGPPAA